jgi:hypothetical protein
MFYVCVVEFSLVRTAMQVLPPLQQMLSCMQNVLRSREKLQPTMVSREVLLRIVLQHHLLVQILPKSLRNRSQFGPLQFQHSAWRWEQHWSTHRPRHWGERAWFRLKQVKSLAAQACCSATRRPWQLPCSSHVCGEHLKGTKPPEAATVKCRDPSCIHSGASRYRMTLNSSDTWMKLDQTASSFSEPS